MRVVISLRHPGIDYLEGERLRPSGKSKAEVYRLAEKFSSDVFAWTYENVGDLIRNYGGRIVYQPFQWADAEVSGTIYVHGKQNFDIVLTQGTSPARERFTIAHEFGHYILHSNQGQHPMVAPRMATEQSIARRLEWEANWFAGGMLMPSGVFRQAFRDEGGDLLRVAQKFQVSVAAARVRAKQLRLVPES